AMSLLLRTTPAIRSVTRAQHSRLLHVENTVYNNMPFQYRNKRAFAFKVVAYLGLGFSIPFVAANYQLQVSP
ncbi:hypothetical protein BS47DRAFT_1289425, partial [Hydnum rufescens UP504]